MGKFYYLLLFVVLIENHSPDTSTVLWILQIKQNDETKKCYTSTMLVIIIIDDMIDCERASEHSERAH
jgi:hypothetical protein